MLFVNSRKMRWRHLTTDCVVDRRKHAVVYELFATPYEMANTQVASFDQILQWQHVSSASTHLFFQSVTSRDLAMLTLVVPYISFNAMPKMNIFLLKGLKVEK